VKQVGRTLDLVGQFSGFGQKVLVLYLLMVYKIHGNYNDYLGKRIIRRKANIKVPTAFKPEDIIIGNVCMAWHR
jgi:glutamate synthase domain-containing protein 3